MRRLFNKTAIKPAQKYQGLESARFKPFLDFLQGKGSTSRFPAGVFLSYATFRFFVLLKHTIFPWKRSSEFPLERSSAAFILPA